MQIINVVCIHNSVIYHINIIYTVMPMVMAPLQEMVLPWLKVLNQNTIYIEHVQPLKSAKAPITANSTINYKPKYL